jgi:hypothetical protein
VRALFTDRVFLGVFGSDGKVLSSRIGSRGRVFVLWCIRFRIPCFLYKVHGALAVGEGRCSVVI